ncbi:hypothetical protein DFH09DRAFT_1320743 [Mycena vulgaris]|nr:hypothetical protein DFH09DRAFT_1320743 [Mycena vulgaris]
MMFSATTFISLALIAASAPAIGWRGGGGIEGLIKDFLGGTAAAAGVSARAPSFEDDLGDIGEGVLGGLKDILGTIFRQVRRSFSELTDDQEAAKRETDAPNILTDLLEKAEKAVGALTPEAIAGLESLLGGSSTGPAPVATSNAAASRRSLNELD